MAEAVPGEQVSALVPREFGWGHGLVAAVLSPTELLPDPMNGVCGRAGMGIGPSQEPMGADSVSGIAGLNQRRIYGLGERRRIVDEGPLYQDYAGIGVHQRGDHCGGTDE